MHLVSREMDLKVNPRKMEMWSTLYRQRVEITLLSKDC